MRYELITPETFDDWIFSLDGSLKNRLANRLLQVQKGNFGDHKWLDGNLFELRCFFGGGIRMYCTLRNNQIVLLTGRLHLFDIF